jgi:hypothetical protein
MAGLLLLTVSFCQIAYFYLHAAGGSVDIDSAIDNVLQISSAKIEVPSHLKILVHIPFFVGQSKRFDRNVHCSGIKRDSQQWEDIRYRLLREVVLSIDRFGVRATIVIDTNDISCRDPIMSIVGPMQNSELRIVEHTGLAHGYMLSTVHRANMEAHLKDFDYFMYAEDDVLVPPAAFEYIHKHWRSLYDLKEIPCFMRAVVDAKGAVRFSDTTKPLPLSVIFTPVAAVGGGKKKTYCANGFSCRGRELYVSPRTPFAAAWLYPRELMQDLVRTKTWSDLAPLPERLKDGGIRVDMGRGFSKHDNFAVLVDRNGAHPSTLVWHLGSSGPLHCFSKPGSGQHNTLRQHHFFPKPFDPP